MNRFTYCNKFLSFIDVLLLTCDVNVGMLVLDDRVFQSQKTRTLDKNYGPLYILITSNKLD